MQERSRGELGKGEGIKSEKEWQKRETVFAEKNEVSDWYSARPGSKEVAAEARELVSERDVGVRQPRCFASGVRKRLKNKEIAKLQGPSVGKRIEGNLALFLGGGQEDAGNAYRKRCANHKG